MLKYACFGQKGREVVRTQALLLSDRPEFESHLFHLFALRWYDDLITLPHIFGVSHSSKVKREDA